LNETSWSFTLAVDEYPSTMPLEKFARAKDVIMSSHQIEGLIADGNYIFIINNKVIKADAWLKYHPGGQKVIQHMVGRDATDEVTAYVLLLTY
jgi:delta8-fatty-acid desaturase